MHHRLYIGSYERVNGDIVNKASQGYTIDDILSVGFRVKLVFC